MVQVVPGDPGWGDVFANIGSGVVEGYQNRSDDKAIQKAIVDLGENPSPQDVLKAVTGTKTHNPAAKQNFFKNYLGAKEVEETTSKAALQREKDQSALLQGKKVGASLGYSPEETDGLTAEQVLKYHKAKNPGGGKGKNQSPEDLAAQQKNLVADGWPDYLADLYQKSPPGVQNRMMADHIEAKQRGLRNPPSSVQTPNSGVETGKTSEITPVDNKDIVEAGKAIEAEQPEWPDLPPPSNLTPAEKVKWENGNQKENNKLLHEAVKKNEGQQHIGLLLNRANQLNDSEKIPEGIARLVINPFSGEPYAVAQLLGLVNKETQDFVKTINDFLTGAKDTFGARVTNFDVQAFKARLPTLLNTTEGRRLIIKQMQLLHDLDVIHNKGMEDGLKHYGRKASYSDIQKTVDDKIKTREGAIIEKLNNIDDASDYLDRMAKDPKFKDYKLMWSPEKKDFRAFRKDELQDAQKNGYEVY